MKSGVNKKILYSDFLPGILKLALLISEFGKEFHPYTYFGSYLIPFFVITIVNKISIPLVLGLWVEAYLFVLALVFRFEPGTHADIIITVGGMLLIYILAPLVLPCSSGPFNVGFKVSKLNGGSSVIAFYPTTEQGRSDIKLSLDPKNNRKETLEFFRKIFKEGPFFFRWVVNIALFRFYDYNIGVKEDATFHPVNAKLPTIIFVHGLGTEPCLYSSILTELAKEGYLILCPQILERKVLNEIRTKEDIDKNLWPIRNAQLQKRADTVIETLTTLQDNPNLLVGNAEINKEKIFFMGHSFGGASIIEAAHLLRENEKRKELFKKIEGLVCLDPWFYPIDNSKIHKDVGKPLLIINSQEFLYERAHLTPEIPIIDGKNPELIQSVFKAAKGHKNRSINCYFKNSTHATHTNYSFAFFPFENMKVGASKISQIFNQNHILMKNFLTATSAVSVEDITRLGVSKNTNGSESDLIIL